MPLGPLFRLLRLLFHPTQLRKQWELLTGYLLFKARYGFMETPNVPDILAKCAAEGLVAKPLETTYYLGRERLIPLPTRESKVRMAGWRKKFFVFMSANSRTATEFFQIPPNRVVELGAQLEF